MSKNPDIDMFNELNIPGWKATLFVAVDDEAGVEEAPEDMNPNDPQVVRWEQWIVAGDQYIFMDRKDANDEWGTPELGEYEMRDIGRHVSPYQISCLEDLVEIMAWRINDGHADSVHPVIRALVTEDDLRDAAAERARLQLEKDDSDKAIPTEPTPWTRPVWTITFGEVSKLIKIARTMRKWMPPSDQADEKLLAAIKEYDSLPEYYRV